MEETANIFQLADFYKNLEIKHDEIDGYTDDQKEALYKLVTKKKDFERYNKLAFFKPYPYQLEWIAASKNYRQRYLSAANRIGKTHSACMELASQITGLFPNWWNGRKMEFDSPATFWAIGVSQESVNNVLMKELLGVSDCRNLSGLGTGAIPRECINSFSLVKDGARCLQVRIKHVNGFENTLHFYASTQDESVFYGSSVHYILMDEQFKNETELYAQCLTRTATTKGMISVTATPELGASPLWLKFSEDDSGKLYFQVATWADAEHLTEEAKAELLAGYPEYQRDMRSKGVPVLGEGAVYPYNEEEIDGKVSLDHILNNAFAYKLLWSCDFGYSSNASADPSVLTLLAYHIETDTIYVVEEWNSKQDSFKNRLAHQPEHMASIIKASRFPYAPLICPHDAKKQMDGIGTATTRLSEFKKLGINVLPQVFEIPFQLTTGSFDAPKHPRSLHWTITYINKLFSDGKLKLDTKKLKNLMKEFRTYQWKENGNPVDKNNHHLDSVRYGAVSIKYKGWLANKCLAAGKNKWESSRELNEKLRQRSF
ncbi:terminase large subunit domain-containing protein [Salmonella enterica]|uniref:terminase large subunit domain-containing protein n=1 Tax=Salmonella enterica TaxID=28901 RepID=UPI0031688FDA